MRTVRKADVQKLGYSDGSPYRNRKYIVINGDTIDMSKTGIPLRLIPDKGEEKIAEPYSGAHSFPGATSVKEVPLPKGYKK
jgi:hypothetical protein